MILQIKKLKEEIAGLEQQQRSLWKSATEGGAYPTKEHEAQFDAMQADINEKRETISRIERMSSVEDFDTNAFSGKSSRSNADRAKAEEERHKEAYFNAFKSYALRGQQGLTPEESAILRKGFRNLEIRGTDPQTTTGAAGGYTIPEGFANELESRMLWYGGMMEAGRIYETTNGAPIPFPVVDDTAVTGAILNEDSPSVPVSDMTFGQKLLNAYTYHSNIVKVSIPLLEDTFFDLQDFLTGEFANRIGRIVNTHLTTGNGSDKPTGFVTAVNAVSGWVDAAASASISRDDIIDLIHGVDKAYRPNARLMMSDSTLAAIKKLAFGSGDDRPLYQESAIVGESPRIEGYQFVINNDMPDIGTGNTPIAFGDFQKYVIRRVRDVQMVRLNERYMDQLQTGFIAYMRADGRLIQDNAIKLLKNT